MPRTNSKAQQFDAWLAITGQVPPPDHPIRLPMRTGSMLPAIPVGHVLVIEICGADTCAEGDVIIYQAKDRLVAHRLLTHGPWPWWLEKGDANLTGRWLRPGRILGRVITVESPDGTVSPSAPFDVAAAAVSRYHHWRNLLLAGPRLVRDLLTGKGST